MFRESDNNPQFDIFSSPAEQLRGSAQKFYLKDDSWHNIFRTHVVMQIDESVFKVLFDEKNGAPNASLRVLVSMMILKEGQGWSDEQLFENCKYNLLIRSALGLMSLTDEVPVPSTYYLFRKRLSEYMKETGIDLLKECQSQITENQVLEFGVSGKSIRMDSKLLGSNIAWYSRYELIHETLRVFITKHQSLIDSKNLRKKELELIKAIKGETGNKVVYRSTKDEINARLISLGELMYRFIRLFKNYNYAELQTLRAVFEEQFSVDMSKTVLPLENEEISAKSIQSPHDTDAHYRNKDGNKVKGYVVNVTETCDKKKDDDDDNAPTLNLITDTQVEVVSAADNDFLEKAVEETEKILSSSVEKIHADGAYNSLDNQNFCDRESKELVLTALQGAESIYDLNLDENDPEKLIVFNRETNQHIECHLVKKRNNSNETKWRIKTDKGTYPYFTLENVRTSLLRQKQRKIPIEEQNVRNNVEATIFQLGYHYPNDKTRYRGLAKHKLWAYSRSLWINFVRIAKYVTQISQRPLNLSFLTNLLNKICFKMYINVYLNFFKLKFIPNRNFTLS